MKYENEEKFIKVNGRRITEDELKLMSITELTNIVNDIQIELNYITLKCKEARTDKKTVDKLSRIKLYLQNSMYLVAKIRKAKKNEYNNNFSSLFVEKAKELLDRDLFDQICTAAKDYVPLY